jgi:hypothetical protein
MQQIESDLAQSAVPIACQPSAITSDQRANHFALATRLFTEAAYEKRETADGYEFRFGAEEYANLVAYIGNERLCCPFFRFGLELSPGQGPIWLRLGGGEGVKEFLQSELDGAQR